jgi:hypothetical protein
MWLWTSDHPCRGFERELIMEEFEVFSKVKLDLLAHALLI